MKYLSLLFLLILFFNGCNNSKTQQSSISTKIKPELIFYVGITMVKPMEKLAKEFEEKEGVTIKIFQGGSEDLYQSAKSSKSGDLYMPGTLEYRKKHLNEGVFEDEVSFVGYNRAALMVAKNNPKNIKADVHVLLDPQYKTVLCNPESGSIGIQTKKILEAIGIYKEAIAKSVFLTTDSQNLTKAIKSGDADVVLNWRATGFWEGNREICDILDLPESISPKDSLVLIPLKSSQYRDKVNAFMQFARSHNGRAVFHEFGFLTDAELENYEHLEF